MLIIAVFLLFMLLFLRYKFTQCQKDLLGARWLRTPEVGSVAIVVPLAGCFSVPLSIFLINRGYCRMMSNVISIEF